MVIMVQMLLEDKRRDKVGLLVDWLELLGPTIISSCPELQMKLVFGKSKVCLHGWFYIYTQIFFSFTKIFSPGPARQLPAVPAVSADPPGELQRAALHRGLAAQPRSCSYSWPAAGPQRAAVSARGAGLPVRVRAHPAAVAGPRPAPAQTRPARGRAPAARRGHRQPRGVRSQVSDLDYLLHYMPSVHLQMHLKPKLFQLI